MQVSLLGLSGSGVKTSFSAIIGLGVSGAIQTQSSGSNRISVLQVPDRRLELLTSCFQPLKTVPVAIQIIEFPGLISEKVDARSVAKCRETDALAFVLRSFESSDFPHIRGSVDPIRVLNTLEEEILLMDLEIVEGRLDKLKKSLQKKKDPDEELEVQVLRRCLKKLEAGAPLREMNLRDWEKKLIRGFGFLTQKPVFVLLNIGDEQIQSQKSLLKPFLKKGYSARAVCADIESELAHFQNSERLQLMGEFGIEELAAPVVVEGIFHALELVTFYTVGEDECRAWTICRGQTAIHAAARIHSDLAERFIRAEVTGFKAFQELRDLKQVRLAGKMRLEGRDYLVQDGDLIEIRHN